MERRLLDFTQVAYSLGISQVTLSKYVKEGRIKPANKGRRLFFRKEDVVTFKNWFANSPGYKRSKRAREEKNANADPCGA